MPPRVSAVRHFVLPDLGEGLTAAEIVAWHVAVGDEVSLNQVLVEVETEKAVVELPSPFAGTVSSCWPRRASPSPSARRSSPSARPRSEARGSRQQPEERVPTLVGYGPSDAPPSRRRTARAPRRGHRAPTRSRRPASAGRSAGALHGTAARRRPGHVTGHGPGGVITREDLAAHLAGARPCAPGGERREARTPVRGVQKHMAEAMMRSVASAPQACVFLTSTPPRRSSSSTGYDRTAGSKGSA